MALKQLQGFDRVDGKAVVYWPHGLNMSMPLKWKHFYKGQYEKIVKQREDISSWIDATLGYDVLYKSMGQWGGSFLFFKDPDDALLFVTAWK